MKDRWVNSVYYTAGLDFPIADDPCEPLKESSTQFGKALDKWSTIRGNRIRIRNIRG